MNSVVVLIPHHNNTEGLKVSLRSIAAGEKVDVLVVDDGSDEKPLETELAREFKGAGKLHLLSLERNSGITAALNRGVGWAVSSGYILVGRLDAGDCVIGERFSGQEAFLTQHPDYVLVGCWVEFVDSEHKPLFQFRPPVSDHDLRVALKQYNPFIHPGVMMRVDAIMAIGGYPSDFPALEDWAAFMALKDFGKIAILDKVMLRYEVAEDSISSRKRRQQVRSKIRLLLRNYDLSFRATVGLARNLLVCVFPRSVLTRLKTFIFR